MSDGVASALGNIDAFYYLVVGCLVFFMQAGFGMLEAGSVRAKNTKNILLKNMLDACIGALIWWGWGYGVAYQGGGNGFIGTDAGGDKSSGGAFFANGWYGALEDPNGLQFAAWWFQYGFAAAAATIVSGAVAERTQLTSYLIYTCVITGFIYPVVVHWVWATGGFLSAFSPKSGTDNVYPICGGCIDFAGSGVVHMTGGVAALVGAAFVGPRMGRFDENKKPVDMPGHSSVLTVLGTFILWLGWYGFNPGSTLSIITPGYGQAMARVVVTTTLAAAAGGITTLVIDKLIGSKVWNLNMVCNGVLGGLVSITAGCATCSTWYAVIIGFLGAFVYYGSSKLLLNVLKIDDPLDAFAVHGACGAWGVLANALFADPLYSSGFYAWGPAGKEYNSLFFGGGKMLGAAVTALVCEIAWVGIMSAIMFFGLKMAKVLRVSEEIESAGMDTSKHGGGAYDLGATTTTA